MLSASRERIERELGEGQLVLDVGGWARPLARADWVIDLMPWESRGIYGERDPGPERFDESTWVVRDICDREPWPFEADQFDFAVCSQTLEDIRDPVWVCQELARVARAGYIEVPSRAEEQAHGVHGDWIGFSHHRWLVDVAPGRIEFVFKPAIVQADPELSIPGELGARLTEDERSQCLWWEGSFETRERIFLQEGEIEKYLVDGISDWKKELAARGEQAPKRRRLLGR